jgi:hypothetical protein
MEVEGAKPWSNWASTGCTWLKPMLFCLCLLIANIAFHLWSYLHHWPTLHFDSKMECNGVMNMLLSLRQVTNMV